MNFPRNTRDVETKSRWRPRFGLGTLILVMSVASVMGAAAHYFARSLHDGAHRLIAMLITFSAPLVLLVLVSFLQELYAWSIRRKKH